MYFCTNLVGTLSPFSGLHTSECLADAVCPIVGDIARGCGRNTNPGWLAGVSGRSRVNTGRRESSGCRSQASGGGARFSMCEVSIRTSCLTSRMSCLTSSMFFVMPACASRFSERTSSMRRCVPFTSALHHAGERNAHRDHRADDPRRVGVDALILPLRTPGVVTAAPRTSAARLSATTSATLSSYRHGPPRRFTILA